MREEMVADIRKRELENDGQTVNVYYDSLTGNYLAFGLSAYYITMAINAQMSYSDALELPVALISRKGFVNAKQSMELVEKLDHDYHRFKTRRKIGDAGYEKWLDDIGMKKK